VSPTPKRITNTTTHFSFPGYLRTIIYKFIIGIKLANCWESKLLKEEKLSASGSERGDSKADQT
jgi:hypothetical protein